MIQMSFTAACNKFFGLKPGQTISDFAKELKALDEKDREWFKREFVKIGVEIV